jgi:hypothetical protein
MAYIKEKKYAVEKAGRSTNSNLAAKLKSTQAAAMAAKSASASKAKSTSQKAVASGAISGRVSKPSISGVRVVTPVNAKVSGTGYGGRVTESSKAKKRY